MLNIYVEERVAYLRAAERRRELERQHRLHASSSDYQRLRRFKRGRGIIIWLGRRVQRWNKWRHAGQAADSSRWERRQYWPAARTVDQQPR
jgi:hypothetical protein